MKKVWEPGERLERWLVLKRFKGAWGVVYLLRDLSYEDHIARPAVLIAKSLRPEWSADEQQVERFEREAYAWLSLGIHKHIVRLFSVDRFFGQVFAFGEYVPEILLPNTLRGWIDAHITDLEITLRFGVQICRALSYARSCGVLVHQDLKPENIMITRDGVVKVTDWGLSHMEPSSVSGLSSAGDIPYLPDVRAIESSARAYGTPGYAAPEILTTGQAPTPRADVFSLGVLLVEMISGHRPSADTPASEVLSLLHPLSPPVRSRLADCISACLSSSPDERPDSTDAVESVLKDAFSELAGVPIEEPPFKAWESATDLAQRGYALFMLGRIDEAMKIFETLRHFKENPAEEEKTGEGQKRLVMVMDYKEHGWKTIVPSELIIQIEKQLESDSDDLQALRDTIAVNYLAGHYERALELCLRYLEREPDNREMIEQLSEIYAHQEKWREAIASLDRALALQPDDAELWLRRSKYFVNTGDSEEAMRSAQKAAALSSESEDAHLHYGHLLAESGNTKAALTVFEEATRINSESALAWYNVGTCWNKLGRPDLAFEFLMRAVEKDPNFAVALNTLAALAIQANAFQEALVFLERAIAADPNYERPWFNKGKVLEVMGRFEEAREAYLSALAINPNYELARDALEQLETEHLL